MIGLLKVLQLLTSIGLLGLAWMVYPGVTVVFATAVGLCYVAAAALAMRDYRVGIWLAFVFTVLTAAFSGYGVYRYVQNGFDFLTGSFGRLSGVYLPPYLFVLIAVSSAVVVMLHLRSWRWMLRGRAAAGRG